VLLLVIFFFSKYEHHGVEYEGLKQSKAGSVVCGP